MRAAACCLALACGPMWPALARSAEAPAVAQIEAAHGAETLRRHRAIRADIDLRFGGKPRVVGTLIATTDGGKTRIEHEDGRVVTFDGTTAWVSPQNGPYPGARFDALTWSYFLLAPFKLGDDGARFDRDHGVLPWIDTPVPTGRLTFGTKVGDAPDDWYVVYADPESNRLRGMAYIVTFGPTSVSEAEQEPHAIVYDGYRRVDGALISTRWTFRLWSRERGVHGPTLGTAELSRVRLMKSVPPGTFARPEGAREAPLPGRADGDHR